jgi:hypothetical protein
MTLEIIRMSDLSGLWWKRGAVLVNRNCEFPKGREW